MSFQGLARLARFALLASLASGLVACGLPEDLRTRAESLAERIDRESEAVDSRSQALSRFLAEEQHAHLRRYAEGEDWSAHFDEARGEIDHGRSLFETEVAPLLESDRAEDETSLRGQLTRLTASLDRAAELVREPASRAAFLEDVRLHGGDQLSEARAAVAAATAAADDLEGEVARAAVEYPAKAEDLAGRIAAVRRNRDETNAQLEVAEDELPGLARGDANLARLGDATAAAAAGAAALGVAEAALRGRVAELYRSYSKTLVDMKQEGAVEIGRTSWNDAYDFPRETETRSWVDVSPEDLETLEAVGDRPIAKLSSFFGRKSLTIEIDQRLWDALRVDAVAGLPRGDDSAEFWVGDSRARYYHRYAVVEGETSQETDWQEVSEEVFEDNYDDLGMDILAKPYGLYEDEALREAAPPGMAYVGDSRYGQWEEDAQGRRQWAWGQNFLFYYLLFGGPRHHYYYNDWGRWNRDYRGRSAWYGANDSYGTYGSRTRNSPRYAGSGFGRSGGFGRADRSIRGAGPGGRGGGPGGGGK